MERKPFGLMVGLTVLATLILATLACGNAPARPDTQATVAAFYATITAQAQSGSPFPTRVVATLPPGGSGGSATEMPRPSPIPTATPPDARTGLGISFTIPRCTEEISPNGQTDDWKDSGVMINLPEVTFGRGEWQNDDDLAGDMRLCWTNNALFLLVDVRDDIHVQDQDGVRLYLGDEIEVLFDADLRGDFSETEKNEDDTHLGLSPGNFDNLPPRGVQYVPDLRNDDRIQVGAQRELGTGGNYMLEGVIPWTVFRFVPEAGKNYGLCIAVSDNDHVGEGQQDTMISHCTELETPDPTTWVTVSFGQ